MAVFTLDEVSKHKEKNSCWLVIKEGVYDVTKFMDEHPGGEEVLLEQGGRESTEVFNDVGHSTDARELMIKYKIGELCDEDKAKLKKAAEESMSSVSGSTEGGAPSWMIAIGIAVLAAVLYGLYLY